MSHEWVIIDTEITGLSSPIHVVEIQELNGESFVE